MKATFRTDRGRVRMHNEDQGGIFFREDPSCMAFAVIADGMGGHKAGDVASEMTVSILKRAWEDTDLKETPASIESFLHEQIQFANSELYQHSLSHTECEGMGTTIVAALCTERTVTIVNVGDSRCYLFNEDGFKQVTEDHSLVNELVRSGQISKEDAEHHPRKNVILRALGTEANVEVDVRTIVFEEGDMILLCSDGLSDKLSETEIMEILKSGASLDEMADTFIQRANDNGGEDNITLAILLHNFESERG